MTATISKRMPNSILLFRKGKWLGKAFFSMFDCGEDEIARILNMTTGNMKANSGCQKKTRTENSNEARPKKVPSSGPVEPGYPTHRTFVIHDSYNAMSTPKK